LEDQIFQKLKKKQNSMVYERSVLTLFLFLEMNELGVFDEAANTTRIRSLFKVEMQRLLDSTAPLYREILSEKESAKEIEATEVEIHTEEGRRLRKGNESLFVLRTGKILIILIWIYFQDILLVKDSMKNQFEEIFVQKTKLGSYLLTVTRRKVY
jgi:uncharacterized protein YrrD